MIIEVLRTVLLEDPDVAAAFGDRIYPDAAPDAPTFPLVVLTKVSGLEGYDLGGRAGFEEARVQADVYSERGASDSIAKKQIVKNRLSAFAGGPLISGTGSTCAIDRCLCINDFASPESSTEHAGPRLRRRILEFRIWNREI